MRLASLEIEDFALIARASLEFSDGFTVCSGETGSGKTMLLGALAFALGERSSADIVRSGADRARVTLAIELDDALRARLSEDGFEPEGDDESVILVRDMTSAGKSSARVNGRLATASQLRAIGALVLDAVGQHEQQRLLSRTYQLDVLDAFAGPSALAKRELVASGYARAQALAADVERRADDVGRALAELEFARFAAGEIDDAAPTLGEDETVRERRDYLGNVEKIRAALARAHEAVAGSEAPALEALGAAAASVAAIARFSPTLEALAASLATVQNDANDVAIALARQLDETDLDTSELEAAAARLDLIEKLKKKYGGSLAGVLATRKRFGETIERESSRDAHESELRARLAAARTSLATDARALGELRVKAARALEQRVATELAGLAMPAARFAVVLEASTEIGPHGGESVEFALAPNPGEALRSLARAASGGELARVLLALVVVLADRRERTALVFDEIDAGIGGATARAVGVRIGTLARTAQVLCVTHLAQIASWADRHSAARRSSNSCRSMRKATYSMRSLACSRVASRASHSIMRRRSSATCVRRNWAVPSHLRSRRSRPPPIRPTCVRVCVSAMAPPSVISGLSVVVVEAARATKAAICARDRALLRGDAAIALPPGGLGRLVRYPPGAQFPQDVGDQRRLRRSVGTGERVDAIFTKALGAAQE